MLSQNQMVNAMSKAKKAIESLYTGTCTIVTKEPCLYGSITKFKDVTLYEDEPCRLSYDNDEIAADGDVPTTKSLIKLFIGTDVTTPAGSTITITQNGVTESYEQAGYPKRYATHKEISLKTVDEA